MQEENIYEKLSAFDFHAPVNVTVSFEDSDEDQSFPSFNNTKTTVDYAQSENHDAPRKSSPISGNTEDASDESHELMNLIKAEPIVILTDSDETESCPKLSPIISVPPVKREGNNNAISRKRKRKISSNTDLTSGKKFDRSNETDLQNVFEPTNTNTHGCNVIPSSTGNDTLLKQLLSSEVSAPEQHNENVTHEYQNLPKTNSSTNNASSSIQSIDPIIMECYKNLLNSVSRNLIQILNIYDDTVKNINKFFSRPEIQQAWYKFNVQKHQLFHMSYSTVVNVILPQANNKGFIAAFLRDTCNLIAVKDEQRNEKIVKLFTEMLDWSMKKASPKPSETSTQEQFYYKRVPVNPLIRQHYNHTVLQQQHTATATDPACQINGYANNVNITSMASDTTMSSKQVQNNILYPYPTSNYNNNFNKRTAVLSQTAQINNQAYSNQNGYVPYSSQNPNKNCPNGSQQATIMPTDKGSNVYQTEQRNDATTYSLAPANFDACQFNNNTNMVRTQQTFYPPPPYPSHVIMSNAEKPVYMQQPVLMMSQPCDRPTVIENTRSMSADSGIVSPANVSNTPGPTKDSDETRQNESSPLIAHVTSLNPQATFLPKGNCFICRSPTNKKCLGCLKVYYCSLDCQKADWHLHMPICRTYT